MDVLKARERARRKEGEGKKPERAAKKPRPKKRKRAGKSKSPPHQATQKDIVSAATAETEVDIPEEAKAPEELELTEDDLRGLYGTQEMPELPDIDTGPSLESAMLGSELPSGESIEPDRQPETAETGPAEQPEAQAQATLEAQPEAETTTMTEELGEDEGIWKSAADEEGRGETPLEFLSFMLGKEEYALPLARISEIIKPRTITEVPRCPEFVKGIVSLRGVIIPVFDLAAKLGLGNIKWERPARIIIVRRLEGELVGLAVDSVRDVVRVLPSDIEPPPPALAGVEAQYLDGVGRAEDSRRTRVQVGEQVEDVAQMEKTQTMRRKLVILLNLDKVAAL